MGQHEDLQLRPGYGPRPKHESLPSRHGGTNHFGQAHWPIGKQGDFYEEEADGIAEQVWATPSSLAIKSARPNIRRVPVRPAGDAATVPVSVDRVVGSSGSPLEPVVRHDVEQRFGHDFSLVRVHAGPAAEQSARDVNAHAYTVGRDIVFGKGQYAPDTVRGRRVLAHELTHVLQQGDGPADASVAARLQRFSFSDLLETGASISLGPIGESVVHSQKQFVDDLVTSIRESPQYVAEFFEDEVWESIKNHWVKIIGVTVGLIAAEMAVAALTAVPEPTLLTKVIAVILQLAIIAIMGYFAAVEAKGAYDDGKRWLATAKKANGDPTAIAEASRSFVRMVWHIVMAVLAVAGVRARIRGAVVPRGAAGSGTSSGAGAAAEGGTVTAISSHPKFQARPQPPATGQPATSAFGPGGTARRLAPAEQPLPEPVTVPPSPAPAAVAAKTPPSTAGTGPGVQPAPAIGTGVSAGTSERQPSEVVYRGMTEDNGLPKVEPSARGLGVRPTTDVTVVGGVVQADARGMSVARVAPGNLPEYRRPPAWGGSGKDPVWAISSEVFQGPLLFAPDKPGHANVAARLPLPLPGMQAALAATRPLWVPVPGPEAGP
jgi:hypothetical protein